MRVSVLGLGPVGLVTAACLAAEGHEVFGYDIDPDRLQNLERDVLTVREPGLDELVAQTRRDGKLRPIAGTREAILSTELTFICVPTPPSESGMPALAALESCLDAVGEALQAKRAPHAVVVRSTVIPGTVPEVVIPRLERASGKRHGDGFEVYANPEFLREGSAINDFRNPPFVVIGSEFPENCEVLRALYEPYADRLLTVDYEVACAVKYLSNAFHALKVVFANEMAVLLHGMGVDPVAALSIFRSDTILNASAAYLKPGFAFGGSCLPKDVTALNAVASARKVELPVLSHVLASNTRHIQRAVDLVMQGDPRRVAVLGLAFKPGTADFRSSPYVALVEALLRQGVSVRAFDPSFAELAGSGRNAPADLNEEVRGVAVADLQLALQDADTVVVGHLRNEDLGLLRQAPELETVIDLANMPALRDIPRGSYRGLFW